MDFKQRSRFVHLMSNPQMLVSWDLVKHTCASPTRLNKQKQKHQILQLNYRWTNPKQNSSTPSFEKTQAMGY